MPRLQTLNFTPEAYEGSSQTVRQMRRGYKRMRAQDFKDEPAQLTPRQTNFYRNLIALALAVRSRDIPVDFETVEGQPMYLDRGCIKMAEHAGFIQMLVNNDAHGTVGYVTLSWTVDGSIQ